MECHILGPIRVVDDDGIDRTPKSSQQRSVLTLLAAHAPERVGVDLIEDHLWPDGAPSTNALQALISKLRKVVAPARIDGDRHGYALHGAIIDVARFDQFVAEERLGDADALVRGRPLDDLADTPVTLALRARLEGKVLAARVERLEAAARAEPVQAMVELRAMVVAEPLVESWWRLLMIAEYRSGRAADALRTFQRARSTLIEQLGVEPGPDLRELEQRILRGDPALGSDSARSALNDTPPEHPHVVDAPSPLRLPVRLSSFVGRTEELESLTIAIETNRLVTLVGPGGAGKTSTALELARRIAPARAHWVDLAPLDGSDAVIRALTSAVGLPVSEQGVPVTVAHGDPFDRVLDVLTAGEPVIVLDNCEHLIDAVAAIVHRLLAECERVRIVATSREPLAVPGEHLFVLPPLPSADAIELFAARAADHGVDTRTNVDADLVATLCDRLDGLPLAIELAAARLRTMTVPDLLDGLTDRFALLSHGSRTVETRQRTLRAVVDWSHDLLDEVDQAVFRRLAVFVGGCDGDAVRVVCADMSTGQGSLAVEDVDAALVRLVDKSLVVATPTAVGMRFRLLETLGAYARERLVEARELEPTLIRHAQFFADWLQPAFRGLIGHGQPEWLADLATERQNVESALDTALARGDAQLALELTTPLGWYFFMTGELESGGAMLGAALACAGPSEPELRATALGLHGWLAANGPNVERAVATTAEAVEMLEFVHDPFARAIISNTHAMAMYFAGRVEAVEEWFPGVAAAAARSGDPWIGAITRLVEGELLQFRGDSLDAESAFIDAARTFEEVGDQFAYALAITEASEIAEQFGHYDRAVEMLERGIAIADEVGFSSHPSAMRARLANIEILRGNLAAAERHHRSLIDDSAASGVPWLQAISHFGLSMIARRRGELDTAQEHLDIVRRLPRTHAVPHLRALLQGGQGFLADQRGDLVSAIASQREALATARALVTPRGLAYALEGCAGALSVSSDPELSRLGARLLGHADRLRREVGGSMPEAERFDVGRAERRLRAALPEHFDAEFEAGASCDTDTLIAAVQALPAFA